MNKQPHIVIATDYSTGATNAFRYALSFARLINADVTLVHVFKMPTYSTNSGIESGKIREYFEVGEAKKLRDYMDTVIKYLAVDLFGLEITPLAIEGDTIQELMAIADRRKADMIFAGTHGSTGLLDIFMGNHAWEIIRNSKIPVFIIPGNAVFRGIKKIVLATGLNDIEYPAINFVADLARKTDGFIHMVHINHKNNNAAIEHENGKKIIEKSLMDSKFNQFDLSILEKGNIIDKLKNFAWEKHADCLALSNDQSFRIANISPSLFRTTKKISVGTRVPILIIPSANPSPAPYWQLSGLENQMN